MLNLLIDGNYILSKLVYTLHKNNLLYGALHTSLENTISNYKKIFPFKRIYLVSDSKEKSWRKDVYKEYKAKRKKDSDIDWQFVYDTYSEFKKNTNVKVVECPNVEGDDWISFLIDITNKKGESNLVISNDHDIKQLIRYDINNGFINFMTNEMQNHGKAFLPKNWKLYIDSVKKLPNDDIFNLNDNSDFLNLFKTIEIKYEIEEVNPTNSFMIKVISGDISDNIKSVFQSRDKSGNIRGIGIKGAQSIIIKYSEEFGEPDLNDPDIYENFADIIVEKKKISRNKMPSIIDSIKNNVHIIDLRLSNIPEEIIVKMKNVYYSA